MSLKNPIIPPRIDPGTVRLVAQRLNHYTTPGSDSLKPDDNIDSVRNVGLLAADADVGPRKFYWIQSLWNINLRTWTFMLILENGIV